MKVLIIDDIAYQRKLLDRVLKNRKDVSETYTADNGFDGLEKLKNNPDTDLIITDYNMPKCNGEQFIKEIKLIDTLSHIPIIVISSEEKKAVVVKTLKAGAKSYILSPFNAKKVNQTIENVFSQNLNKNNCSETSNNAQIKGLLNELHNYVLRINIIKTDFEKTVKKLENALDNPTKQ